MSSLVLGARSDTSLSLKVDQTVPKIPKGTLTRNTYLQSKTASIPPRRSPTNWPDIRATMFIPRAFPLSLTGKASVSMAELLAMVRALPTA